MSPTKIVYTTVEGQSTVKNIKIAEGPSFTVGPNLAAKILGTSLQTVHHYDHLGIPKSNGGVRIFNDGVLLDIALSIRETPDIYQGEDGLTVIDTGRTITTLDIPWERTQERMRK